MKKSSPSIRILSFFVAMVFVFLAFPYTASSKNDLGISSEVVSETQSENNSEEKELSENTDLATDEGIIPIILEESVELRDETTKHFLCDDGSYVVAQYCEPVHKKSANGKWVEFEPSENSSDIKTIETKKVTVLGNNDKKTVMFALDGKTVEWTVSANINNRTIKLDSSKPVEKKYSDDSKAIVKEDLIQRKQNVNEAYQFAKSMEANSLLTDRSAFDDVYKRVSEINNSITNYNNQFIENVKYNNKAVIFDDAFERGTQLEYVITDNSVKENLIINERCGFESYSISLYAADLTPKLQKDGSISFTNVKDVTVFSICEPLMFDNSHSFSFDISVDIEKEKNGNYRITYTPDSKWLNDESRVFPIVIDPYYTDPPHYMDSVTNTSFKSAFTSFNQPNNNYHSDYYWYTFVGNEGDSNRNFGKSYGFMHFQSLPSMSNKIITHSYLDLFIVPCQTYYNIDAFIPEENWTTTQITWNNMPSPNNTVATNIPPVNSGNGYKFYQIPLGVLPTQWYSSEWYQSDIAESIGLMIKFSNESDMDYNLIINTNSRNISLGLPVPIFTVYYTEKPTDYTYNHSTLLPGTYVIKNQYNNKCLTQNTENGVVELKNYTGDQTQKWMIERFSYISNNTTKHYYTLAPVYSPDFRLEVHCGIYINYRPLTVYGYAPDNLNSSHIKFFIDSENDGTYSIRPYNSSNYAISNYTGDQGSVTYMHMFNQYSSTYRSFYRKAGESTQLYSYFGYDSQKWNFIKESDSLSISSSVNSIEVDAGQTYNLGQHISVLPTDAPNKNVIYSSSNPNIATVNSYGIITTLISGSAVISVRCVADNSAFLEIPITVNPVLSYPDTLINHQETINNLLFYQSLNDQIELSFQNGEITEDVKQEYLEEIEYQSNLLRASYIIVGNNPTSTYAYLKLGRDPDSVLPYSYNSDICTDSENDMTGFHIMVVQLALELYGIETNGKYGIWTREYTQKVKEGWNTLIIGNTFNNDSYRVLFTNNRPENVRTYSSLAAIRQYYFKHFFVQNYCCGYIGSNGFINSKTERRIYYNDGKSYGRADIIARNTDLSAVEYGAYIWEVKSNTVAATQKGCSQVQKYVDSANNYIQSQDLYSDYGHSFYLGESFIPPMFVPWYDEYLAFGSYYNVNGYNASPAAKALIVYDTFEYAPSVAYQEVEATSYETAPAPVLIEEYSFDFQAVIQRLSYAGSAIIKGLTKSNNGDLLFSVLIDGCVLLLAMPLVCCA